MTFVSVPLAYTVPQHKAATCVPSHRTILNAVLVAVVLGAGFSRVRTNRPFSDIVPTDFHTVNHHLAVGSLGEISLHSFISTICITDQYSQVLPYDVVESFSKS